LALAAAGTALAAPLQLVKDGKSAFVIYLDAAVPKSVKLAAEELQRVVAVATGAKLPIVNAPAHPMICLGDNKAARKAGLSSEKMADESFRIVTKDGNLFIIGKDWPDNDKKWIRCDSTGTLFGVYEFLERVVGVRWLMPGEWGEDIPAHAGGLTLASMDVTGQPAVPSRYLSGDLGAMPGVFIDRAEADRWSLRNRLGSSIAPAYSHAWTKHPGVEALKGHPDYMAMRADGTREPPFEGKEGSAQMLSVRYCLTSPGLIQAYADSVMRAFAANPRLFAESMSPSDGGWMCECPECLKFKETDTSGPWGDYMGRGYSYTPLVLHFYNAVARIVGREYPDRMVGGYAYQEYLFPPAKPVRLEPNVFIQVAYVNGYGYKLYKPEILGDFARLFAEWAACTPNLGYTAFAPWMRDNVGAPLPPAISIMKTTAEAFKRLRVKRLDYCGHDAWGNGGVKNYLLARLMWDLNTDLDNLYREYLERAYGPAAPEIDRIYALVEERLRAYVIESPRIDHEVWYDTVAIVHAPIFDEMEKLYGEALNKPKATAQQKRLEMFGDNFVMLHWNMRHARLVKNPEASRFYMSDEAYRRFLGERADKTFALNARAEVVKRMARHGNRPQMVLWPGPEDRALDIPRLRAGVAPPKLDGDLSDAAWQGAAVADAFRSIGRLEMPVELASTQTTARLVADSDTLYLAVECAEPDPKAIRKHCATANSRTILEDNVVELWISPDPGFKADPLATPYNGRPMAQIAWHVAINAANTVMSPVPARSAAAIREKAWAVEAAIPLGAAARGGVWRANIARRKACPAERSTWSSTEEWMDPRSLGVWRIAAQP